MLILLVCVIGQKSLSTIYLDHTGRWNYSKVVGNEKADEFAKPAARRRAPCNDEEVPDGFLTEASLSHMPRSATEAPRRLGGVDRQPRAPRAPAQAPSGERPPPPAPAQHQERVGREALCTSSSPATQRSDRTLRTKYTRSIRTGAFLRHRRAAVQISPRVHVPGLGRPGASHVEEN